jgi:hypothetical protein
MIRRSKSLQAEIVTIQTIRNAPEPAAANDVSPWQPLPAAIARR